MIEMVRRFLRQKSRSGGTLLILAVFAAFSALAMAAAGGRSGPSGGAYLALLVIAAAVVSRDASSGALQMILARPIRRTDYLFGRYVGIVCAFTAFLVLRAVLAVVVKTAWASGGPPIAPLGLLADMGTSVLWAAQIAAAYVFFSTFLPGYGDAIAVLALDVFLALQTNVAWMQATATVIRREVMPVVPWEKAFRGDLAALASAGRGVLAATLFLTAATVIFARREFAYGQD